MRLAPGNRAFSLVEVIVAGLIVLVGFIAVAQINPMGYRGVAMSKERLLARRVARNTIDRVRSLPFGADTSSLVGPVPTVGESIEGKPVGVEMSVTAVSLNIPTASGTTPVGFGTVNVTVQWRQVGGTTNGTTQNSLTMTGGLNREP